jgi:hypothetical protein
VLWKRSRDYGWSFGCRLQTNRRVNGQPLRRVRRPPDGTEGGWLPGGLQVLGVRDGAQSEATHRLTLAAADVRRLSAVRAQIEAGISVCKEHLRLTGCHARSARAQLHQMTCCLGACCVLERERHARRVSIDQLNRRLRFKGRSLALSALERLRSTA